MVMRMRAIYRRYLPIGMIPGFFKMKDVLPVRIKICSMQKKLSATPFSDKSTPIRLPHGTSRGHRLR